MDISTGLWLIISTIVLVVLYAGAGKFIWFRHLLISAFLLINFIYLIWRGFETIPTVGIISLIFGILLLVAEIAGFTQSIIFTLLSWHPFKRKTIPLSEFDELPTVDVFIATYNEPPDLLKRTIAASLMMRYPEEKLKVYVCDDGRRPEVREVTEALGAYYLDRPDNKHQKAGNLNSAMSKTNGEFIVTMDADMVPKANFLERTLGFFTDKNVSFVQSPQVFYNSDAFQFNLFSEDRITNEQDFFMRRLEEGKDRFNSTMYIGSNALFRRSSLEDIGGFATGVITEDMATGMLLQTNGQKTVFVNETLAVGLSPETYADLLKQRDRWCRGNIQVIRKWNPMTIKGLSPMQRLLYMDGIHYWFFGVYKMIYLLAPIMFLVFNIYSIQTDFATLVAFWFPAFLSSQLAFRRIADNKRTTWWSHVYEVALAPYMALSVLMEVFFKKDVKFNVTRKGIQNNQRQFLLRTSMPYLVLLGFSLLSLVLVGIHLLTPVDLYGNLDVLYINFFWILYNAAALLVALMICIERPRFREAERFNVNIEGWMVTEAGEKHPCTIVDLSEYGARIQFSDKKAATAYSKAKELHLESDRIESIILKKHWITNEGTAYFAGVSFPELTDEQYRSLVGVLFVDSEDIYSDKEYTNASMFYMLSDFIRGTEKSPKQRQRESVRETHSLPAELVTETTDINVTVVDYSLSGCRIELHTPIRTDQIFFLKANGDEVFTDTEVRVQWVQKRGKIYQAGLRFLPAELKTGS